MQERERDKARLETILLLIERIRTRLSKTDRQAFVDDSDDIDLISYRLDMVGEMAQKLSDVIEDRYPTLPWREVYGMRNIIAHEYRGIGPERVSITATQELASLFDMCREELTRLD